MFKLATQNDQQSETLELRKVFVNTLGTLMDEDSAICVLEADLGGASGTSQLQDKGERFIQCGISEAHMMGVAAGLSSEGYVPFCHTFAPFAARRTYDQIYMSGAYAHNTINIWGSDPGFYAAHNGGTHTSYEDVALMRAIPSAVVCDPADGIQMEWVLRTFAKLGEGVHYVRGNRKGVHTIYEPGSTFELGKANIIQEGEDIVIFAAGSLVYDALKAAQALQKDKGITVTVADMFSLKPFDEESVRKHAAGKKLAVTFENHNVIGGLGDAVASVLAEEGSATPLLKHGVKERFGQVGSAEFLQEEYGLTSEHLVSAIACALQ